jgi:hypothetical protein
MRKIGLLTLLLLEGEICRFRQIDKMVMSHR